MGAYEGWICEEPCARSKNPKTVNRLFWVQFDLEGEQRQVTLTLNTMYSMFSTTTLTIQIVSLFNKKNKPVLFQRLGADDLYEAIRKARLCTVRRKMTKPEKKTVAEYKQKWQQIEEFGDRLVHEGGTLTYQHLKPVHEGGWLNDETVTNYLKLLEMEHPNVYMMSSYFFDRLLGCPARTSFKGSKIICIDTDVSEPNQIADKHVKRGTSSSGVHHVKHQLDNYNYECVRRWSSRRSFHKARLIYCPINVQNSHWVACAGHLDKLLVKNGEVMT